MSTTYDTITYGGVESDLATWGFDLSGLTCVKSVGRDDVFTGVLRQSTIAAEFDTPTFAFEGQIAVRSNRTGSGGTGGYSGGTIKFVGKRVDQPIKADSGGQGVEYKFKGPWYDLMNTDYHQVFAGNAANYFLPETVMFTGNQSITAGGVVYGWLPISVGDQIQAICQFMLDQYAAQGIVAPFQYNGRTLHSGAIDLTAAGAITGTPGGNYNFYGQAFNYTLPSGMTIDTSLFSLFMPSHICKPMKCAQALLKCLQLSPRINIWFDYTTTSPGGTNQPTAGQPLPTIRFDLVDNMSAVTLPLFTGAKYDGTQSHKSIAINPRYDLRVRSAIITYRITSTVSGQKAIDYVADKWSGNGTLYGLPGASNVSGNTLTDPNAGLRVFSEMIDLQGSNVVVQKGHMDLQQLACIGGSQASKRSWWASKRGGEVAKLEDYRVRFGSHTIPDATIYYAGAGYDGAGNDSAGNPVTPDALGRYALSSHDLGVFTYRIVRGTYHSWMQQSGVILACKCKAIAAMTFTEYDATSATNSETDTKGNVVRVANTTEQHVNLELTNAVPTGGGASGYANFSAIASSTQGEGYIIGSGGIAQYIYKHMNTLQYDGDYVSVAAEFADSSSSQFVTLGNSLCLTGGSTTWTTMNAQIQEITEDYGTHRTSVKIGVAKFLKVGDLSALLNMWRYRREWFNPAVRADNTQIAGGSADMAQASSSSNTIDGLHNPKQSNIFSYVTPPTGSTPGVIAAGMITNPANLTAHDGLN